VTALGLPKSLPIDDVKLIPIIDVYNRYIGGHLRQRGRHYWTRCLWHGDDSTPSLKIYPEQNRWHCYGCQAGGTAIDLVMRAEQLDFAGAVRQLAADYGIKLSDPVDQRRKKTAVQVKLTFEAEFDLIFVRLVKINKMIDQMSHDIRICLRYPSLFMYQIEIDLILDNMLSDDQGTRVETWRRAKKVFPWLI